MKAVVSLLFTLTFYLSINAFTLDDKLTDKSMEKRATNLFEITKCPICSGESLTGSFSEEVEQRRKLRFDGNVQVQDIPLTEKREQTKLFKARNKKRHDIRTGANTNAKNGVNVQHDLGVVQSSCHNLGGGGGWVIINDEDQEISAIPRGSEVIPSKDPGLENKILENFPDGCNRSRTIELTDEDLYVIVPQKFNFC